MKKPYAPVPGFMRERLEIAILCQEHLDLNWSEEDSDQCWAARVWPVEVVDEAQGCYLTATGEQGQTLRIRLDLVRNFPMPVK